MVEAPRSAAEREAWRPPDRLTVSEWADRHRVLDSFTSAEAGPWSTDRTPYLREPMDAFADPAVENIVLLKSTQVGGTELLLNCLGYAIDQDPASTLLVMPREIDALGLLETRIKPMIEASPALTRHKTEWKADWRKEQLRFDRMFLHTAWSNSPAALSSKPIRYLLGDEVDKWPRWSGDEADPLSLAKERTRTHWNRKHVIASTPTTRDGLILRSFESTDRCEFWVPCVHCGTYQVLRFPHVRFPDGERDPSKIRDEDLAIYVCPHCEQSIPDHRKPLMLARGVWCPKDCSVVDGAVRGPRPSPRSRGFKITALYSPWLRWSQIAAEFLESKAAGPARLQNFVNSWLAEPFEEKEVSTEPERIATLARTYHRGTIPDGVVVLTAGVDVQKRSLYYVLRGWGVGEESWLIEAGELPAWSDLEAKILDGRWDRAKGEALRVRLMGVDSGFRTDEVYEFARRHRDRVRPIKGQPSLAGVPFRASKIERLPSGQVWAAGLNLWHVDTAHYKDKLARMMEDGRWHLHADPGVEYLRHIASEQKVVIRSRNGQKSEWRIKPGFRQNHWLDGEVYSAACADMLAVWSLQAPGDASPPPRRDVADDGGRKTWIRPRRRAGGRWNRG